MQIFAAVTLALATTASAIVNTFDGETGHRLNLVNQTIGADGKLYYKGIGRAQIYDNVGPLQAINANSQPNVAVYGNLDRMNDVYPYITSKFTGQRNTFDLISIYVGCILGNVAGNCVVDLVAFRNGSRQATAKLTFTPTSRQSANMQKFTMDSTFKGIDSIRFATNFTDRRSNPGLGGATFLDDISYSIN